MRRLGVASVTAGKHIIENFGRYTTCPGFIVDKFPFLLDDEDDVPHASGHDKMIASHTTFFNHRKPTNATIGVPYNCPHGKKKCRQCSQYETSAKCKRLELKQNLKYDIDYAFEFFYDDE